MRRTVLPLCLLLAGCLSGQPAPLTRDERVAWDKYRARRADEPWGATHYFPAGDGWQQLDLSRFVYGEYHLKWATSRTRSHAEGWALKKATGDPRIRCSVVVDWFSGPDPRPVAWYTHDRKGQGAPPESVAPGLAAHLRAVQRQALRGGL